MDHFQLSGKMRLESKSKLGFGIGSNRKLPGTRPKTDEVDMEHLTDVLLLKPRK